MLPDTKDFVRAFDLPCIMQIQLESTSTMHTKLSYLSLIVVKNIMLKLRRMIVSPHQIVFFNKKIAE
jgi:hypothetical protein